jgi:hypothetical protein
MIVVYSKSKTLNIILSFIMLKYYVKILGENPEDRAGYHYSNEEI